MRNATAKNMLEDININKFAKVFGLFDSRIH
jgi:hypothetical protein